VVTLDPSERHPAYRHLHLRTIISAVGSTWHNFGRLVFAILYAASTPERRRLLDALRLAGAIDAETAMTPFELAGDQSDALPRLIQDGLVVATSDGHVYLNQQRVDWQSDRVRIVGLGAIALIVFTVGTWLLLRPE
jgi:hypothetical protein